VGPLLLGLECAESRLCKQFLSLRARYSRRPTSRVEAPSVPRRRPAAAVDVSRIVRSPPSSVLHAREPSASLSECGSTLVKPTHVRCYVLIHVLMRVLLICRRADSRASPPARRAHATSLNARRARPREKDIVEKGPALLEKSKSLSDLVSPPLHPLVQHVWVRAAPGRGARVCAAPVSTFEFGLRGRPSVHRRFRRPDRTPLKNRPTGPGRLRGERGGRKQDTLTNSHSQGTRWIHLGAFPR
jgi:hypothetical protein